MHNHHARRYCLLATSAVPSSCQLSVVGDWAHHFLILTQASGTQAQASVAMASLVRPSTYYSDLFANQSRAFGGSASLKILRLLFFLPWIFLEASRNGRLDDIFWAVVQPTSKMIAKDGAANPEAAGSRIKIRTIIAALTLVASFTAQNVTLV